MVEVSNSVVVVLAAYSARNFAMAVVASIRVVGVLVAKVVVEASVAKVEVVSTTMAESAELLVPVYMRK